MIYQIFSECISFLHDSKNLIFKWKLSIIDKRDETIF